MIEIKFDKGKFNMNIEANVFSLMEMYVNLLDATEKDFMLKYAFEMAKSFRKDRDAKDNTSN